MSLGTQVFGQSSDGGKVDTTFVQNLLQQARAYKSESKLDSTIYAAQKAERIAKDIQYSKGQHSAAIILVDTYIDRQELQKADSIVNKAIQEFSESDQIHQLYKLKGGVLYDQGNIIDALPVLKKALEMAEDIPEGSEKSRFIAEMHQNLASIYQDFGNMNLSFENYLKAIEFATASSDSALLTILYNNLGNAYQETKEYEKARYYLEASLRISRSINNKIDEYRASLNLANLLRDQEEFEQALVYYEQSESLWKELRPNTPPAIIVHNKGVSLRKMGRFEVAEDYLLRSLEMSKSIQLPQGIFFNHLELSRLYGQTGRIEASISQIEQALPLAEGSGSLTALNVAQQQAQSAYAQAGKYEKAYKILADNKALTDSLTNIEKEKELSQLKSTLELSRQQEVNQLLEEKQSQQEQRIFSQNILIAASVLIILLIAALLVMSRKRASEKQQLLEELQDRKDELEQLNQAKDRVFAIVSHDLRSPLTSVQGVLELVKDELLDGNDLKKLVEEIDVSIKENVDVIEDLLAWAKEQLSGMKMVSEKVELKPLINDVIQSQSFLAIRKDISLTSTLDDEIIKGDTNATRIIFRNLISNAIKYTEKGDSVEVSSKQNDNSVIIKVKDNGVGIPKESAQKIFNSKTWSTEGTKKEKGSGFGLSLSKEFTERMGGRIWFESEEGEGTTFFVELPKA
ncbi:tetratricopeptide repeat protein [Gracilimonas tropica]|uniref:ATP-binding protein n=1 Tax=Gracilimonas tropica TaxID=454600 RepID=UPI000378EDDB|nr:tetratricopeptide repeat protein [Gracilimonas tropica]